jgi:3-phosphoshikimate 1-carboxyvinyltransferase
MGDRRLSSKVSNNLKGEVNIPGDKSISHRALILASQALGHTKISGLLESEDVLNTAECLKRLGVEIKKDDQGIYHVIGEGISSLQEPTDILDCGNSGTGCRLLMGLVAPYKFSCFFTGDESLRSRPMNRIKIPLSQMGAKFESREGNRLPAMIKGSDNIMPIEYEVPMPSAQVKSSVLLAGLNSAGTTKVIEKVKTRDHTELMMQYLGLDLKVEEKTDGTRIISITGQKEYQAKDLVVPSDPSSAAFIIVAALISEGSEIIVNNVLLNPTRVGLFEALKRMGANIEIKNERIEAGDKVGDITAKSSKLKAIDLEDSIAPSMIDEYPILAVAAACADGTTIMRGLQELRVKESDRLSLISKGLTEIGIENKIKGEDLYVNGGEIKGGASIETHGDHRIAMSFLIAGLVSKKAIEVKDADMIATSFPSFENIMKDLGADISAS